MIQVQFIVTHISHITRAPYTEDLIDISEKTSTERFKGEASKISLSG